MGYLHGLLNLRGQATDKVGVAVEADESGRQGSQTKPDASALVQLLLLCIAAAAAAAVSTGGSFKFAFVVS